MIAYTAWDGLHAIATEYDADLRQRTDGRVALAPHRPRFVSRFAARLAPGLAALLAAVASSTA